MDLIPCNMETAVPLVVDVLKANLVPNLLSSPGIGKSALAKMIRDKFDLFLIDVRLSQSDPVDLNGFPHIYKRTVDRLSGLPVSQKAGYVPMDTFPVVGDPMPVKTWKKDEHGNYLKNEKGYRIPDTYYKGWLLLCDEFNSAPLTVQAAAYKLVLDREVGSHRLHPAVAIMAAGNLNTDNAIVNRLSTAMQSRMIHLNLEADTPVWLRWADRSDVDHRVKSFIRFKPDALHKFDPHHNDLTFPCPRTWDFMSGIIKPMPKIDDCKLPLTAGTVGVGMGREFLGYTQIYGEIPTIEEILANPTGVQFGQDAGMSYALTGLLAHHMNKDNGDKLITFTERLDIDYQVITFRAAIAKDRALKHSKGIQKWVARHAAALTQEEL